MTKNIEKTAVSLRMDPRIRMKEIRAEVASYLKDNPRSLPHLGALPETLEDARRVIVSVQDLLEIEREKHNKASAHICDLVRILNEMSEVQQELMTMVQQRDIQIGAMMDRLDRQEHEISLLDTYSDQHRAERDAVLMTMGLMMAEKP